MDRTRNVQIGSYAPTPLTLKCEVTRGSLLGPNLVIIYTILLGNMISNHGVRFVFMRMAKLHIRIPRLEA